jgi:cystathionine beta-lyase
MQPSGAISRKSMNPPSKLFRHSTLCVHAGTHLDSATGGACSPIYNSTAFAFPNPAKENFYPRYFNTPNQRVIEAKVAALEGGEAAVVFGSGMAAITTLLFAHLKPGDHAVFQPDLYGGTFLFAQELTCFGVAVSFARTAEEFASSLRPETKVLYVESPTNPLLRLIDLAAIGKLGGERGVLTVADNTFATPINQNPLALGIDAVVHSGTKYLNGHSDLNAGAIVGASAMVERTREYAVNHGGMLDAHACFLLERGLKTLALRVKQHNENAQRLAEFIVDHPAVAQVHYPGLPCHSDHALAARQMRGFGGMLSFELRDPERMDAVLAGFRLVMPALSLGGVESLVCAPARTSHRKLTCEDRQRAGIRDGLVRVSVGVEDADDLIEDFARALECAGCC